MTRVLGNSILWIYLPRERNKFDRKKNICYNAVAMVSSFNLKKDCKDRMVFTLKDYKIAPTPFQVQGVNPKGDSPTLYFDCGQYLNEVKVCF